MYFESSYIQQSSILGPSFLDTASRANALGSAGILAIGSGNGRALHVLAKFGNIHSLPARDSDHALEEKASRAGGVHVALDVLVVHGSLLENADAVVVGADTVVLVVEGLGNRSVGQDAQARLVTFVSSCP